MTYAMSALVVVGVLEVAATWWLLRGLHRLDRVDARLAHVTEALRLLAETTEAGFRASAQELSRLAERSVSADAAPAAAPSEAPKATSRTRTRRVTTSVRKGTTLKEAAAAEGMSESEARLRLLLAQKQAARQAGAKEASRASMRA